MNLKVRRVIVVLTVVIVALGSFINPNITKAASFNKTEVQVYNELIQLRFEFPEGTPYTNDDYYASKLKVKNRQISGKGCFGFAALISDRLFGSLPASIVIEGEAMKSITADNIHIGDIIRINDGKGGHSVVVLAKTREGIYLVEGNYSKSVHWGRFLSYDQVRNTCEYLWSRWPLYTEFDDSVYDIELPQNIYSFFAVEREVPSEPARVAPYYNITECGGEWDAENEQYYLDGELVHDAFFCDGTYTYYLETTGKPMKNRLTYHPDGFHVIYFDENGHEVFSNFTHVTMSIAGEAVDDYCFFDVYGYMYVDVMTYDQTGTKLYYINPYGQIERKGWFQFSTTAVWAGTKTRVGKGWGYGQEDGTLMVNTNTYKGNKLVYMQGNGHMK